MEGFWPIVKFCWNHWIWTVPICTVVSGFVAEILCDGVWGDTALKRETPKTFWLFCGLFWLMITVILCVAVFVWTVTILATIIVTIVVVIRRRRAFCHDPG